MSLTTAQLQALKTEIQADAALMTIWNQSTRPASDRAFDIAVELNKQASPAFTVWKTSVTIREIMSNGFRWTDIDSLTAAKYRTWEQFVWLNDIDPSKANIRQGLRDCWGAGSQQETAILPHLKRTATRAEKVLATGTGSDSSPATMGYEGSVPYQSVINAMAS